MGVLIAIGIDERYQEHLHILQHPLESSEIGQQFVGQVEHRLRCDPLPTMCSCLNVGHATWSCSCVQRDGQAGDVASLVGATQRLVATELRIARRQTGHEVENLVIAWIMREESACLTTLAIVRTTLRLAATRLTLRVVPFCVGAVPLQLGHQFHQGLRLVVHSQLRETRLELRLLLGTHRQHGHVAGEQPKVNISIVCLQVHHITESTLITMLHRVLDVPEVYLNGVYFTLIKVLLSKVYIANYTYL